MKSNRQFRQQAQSKVGAMIWLMGYEQFLLFKNPTIKGTYFSSIKQTRIINKLKELLK